MNYYRFSDLTISMTCRYDIMKRRAEKYLITSCIKPILSPTNAITLPTFSPISEKIVLKTGASAVTAIPIADTSPEITGAA